MISYILLFRHGSVNRDYFTLDKHQILSAKGIEESYEVAKALVDTIKDNRAGRKINIGQILYAPTRVSRDTAEIVIKTFKENKLDDQELKEVEHPKLDPEYFWKEKGSGQTKNFVDEILSVPTEDKNAILIIGHQPQLGWLGNTISKKSVPIARSEIICIAVNSARTHSLFSSHGRILWSIALSDEKTLEDLKEKIKSKMELAKTLGAFLIAVLGIALNLLLDPDSIKALIEKTTCNSFPLQATYIATGLFFLASILYLATIYAYDRLLMPSRFWAEIEHSKESNWLVERPPSPNVWILYQNMMRVWNYMFTPATVFVVSGLLALSYAAFKPPLLWFSLIIAFGIRVWLWYYKHFSPVLGTED